MGAVIGFVVLGVLLALLVELIAFVIDEFPQ